MAYQSPNYPANYQYNQYGGHQQYPPNMGYLQPGQPMYGPQYQGGPPPAQPRNYPYEQYQSYPQSDRPRLPSYSESSPFLFTSKSIRLAFVRKVYAILTLQLFLTIALMAMIMFVEPIKKFIKSRPYLLWIAVGITLVLVIVLGCFTKPRRTFPLNVILLAVFTLAEGFLLGVISASRETRYVMYAGLITVGITVAITIFAFQTKIDFTYLSGGLVIVSLVFVGFGIFAFILRSKLINLVYCCVGVLLFSIFLLVDTQLMLGGKHSYSISPEDYIFAALNLYIDIVQIFLMVLGIFSNSD